MLIQNELKIQLSELLHEIIKKNKEIIDQGSYSNLLSLCEQDITIIAMIHQEEGLTAKEICKKLNAPKTTIVTAVSRLVDRGYMIRIQNPKDKREMLLQLTSKGMEAHHEHIEFENLFLDYLVGRWTEKDQQELTQILKRRREI